MGWRWGGGGGGGKNNNQQVGQAILGGLILGAAINQAMQPPRRPNYYPSNSNHYPSHPQYVPSAPQPQYIYESQPTYSQPAYSSSQPVERIISSRPVERVISSGETVVSSRPVETVVSAESVVTPKPNVVKESPKPNVALKSLAGSLAVADGLAADPLLAVTTQKSVANVTQKIGDFVAASGSPEMQTDWQKVIDGGTASGDIVEWWKKHGPAVNDPAIKALEPVHVAMSKFVQDLQDGLLSTAGKKSAIDKIAGLFSALPAGHALRSGFVADLARMRQF